MAEQTIDPINSLLAEFGTRLNEVEEKQRLLRDRALLIGENLINTKEEYDNQDIEFKKEINKINEEIKMLKQINNRIINEIGNMARKSDVEIINRKFEMFEPLELARIKDVENMIREAIKSRKNN